MEVRIKQGEEMIDATIEMVDGVMVVSPKEVKFEPKEVKFEPKDGDVIVSGGDTRFVAIFNKMRFDYSLYYYALLVLDGDKRPQIIGWASFLNVRPATEEEKQKLFDKLAEEGLSWDSEKKEIVKLKWYPKNDELYCRPKFNEEGFACCKDRWDNVKYENFLYNKGWIFKTEQECQEFCNRLNEAINSVKP